MSKYPYQDAAKTKLSRFIIGLTFIIIVFTIGLYSAKATADTNWYRVATNTTLAIDWVQTREIARNTKFHETNKILGKYPSQAEVNQYFIASIVLANVIGELLPEDMGDYFYAAYTAHQTLHILHNVRIGVQFKW